VVYNRLVYEVFRSRTFDDWLSQLSDRRARAKVQARVARLSAGNPGDVKPVGAGISELRIDYGPGYRVYYMQRRSVVIVLLCGGDKSTQAADIKLAHAIAKDWME
jgi:putative addiction module killer protein